jgi:RNA polymerase sigma factor (sigma-70 family)
LEQLLKRLCNGDMIAWREFVDSFTPVIRISIEKTYTIHGAVWNFQDVEDRLQEVFIRLVDNHYKNLVAFSPEKANMKTYLSVISRNITIDHLRKRKPEDPLDDQIPETLLFEEIKSEKYEKLEYPHEILSGRQNLILRLLIDRNMSIVEVAEAIGVKPQTVRSMKNKAVTRLRRYFEEKMGRNLYEFRK